MVCLLPLLAQKSSTNFKICIPSFNWLMKTSLDSFREDVNVSKHDS